MTSSGEELQQQYFVILAKRDQCSASLSVTFYRLRYKLIRELGESQNRSGLNGDKTHFCLRWESNPESQIVQLAA